MKVSLRNKDRDNGELKIIDGMTSSSFRPKSYVLRSTLALALCVFVHGLSTLSLSLVR